MVLSDRTTDSSVYWDYWAKIGRNMMTRTTLQTHIMPGPRPGNTNNNGHYRICHTGPL